MSKGQTVRSYEYVNHPYEAVRDALCADTLKIFSSATKAATSRARSLASELHIEFAGITVGAEIAISVTSVVESTAEGSSTPSTCVRLEWGAASMPGLFPMMKAELNVYPLTSTETQLDFSGTYEPPLGLVGGAFDAIVGHRIAEGSVHRFVNEVAEYLRTALKSPG